MMRSVSLKSAAAEVTSAVVTRSFWIGIVLVLLFGGTAFGEGTYQRTKDGKTIVWNTDPRPGEAATWSGHRDPDGYATKFGTLTWYTARGTVYAWFYGNMVHGKFDGMVNGHSKQRTAHAIFADGQRTTPWAAGRAGSFRVAPTPPVRPTERLTKTENAELRNLSPANRGREQASGLSTRPKPESIGNAPPASTTENVDRGGDSIPAVKNTREQVVRVPIQNATAKESSPKPAPSAVPAPSVENASAARVEPAAPAEEPPAPSAKETPVARAEPEAPAERPPAPSAENTPVARAEPEAPAQGPPTPSAQTAPVARAEPEAPAQGPPTPSAENAPVARVEPEAPAEGPPTPSVENTPVARAEPEAPAEGPRIAQAEVSPAPASPPPNEQTSTPDSKGFGDQQKPSIKKSPFDDPDENEPNRPPTSGQKLAPDGSLRSFAEPPPALDTVREGAVSPKIRPRLTSEEVISLANGEARKHGYNRGDYRRDEPEFNPNFKTWSVSYEQSTDDGMVRHRFNVVVDDKTKGAILLQRQ